ncbi:MAG: dihydroorotate dehydrogenase-like protein [Thermoanaerobaculia bacterium]
MDLTTRYLGLELAHPLMPGASPMVDDLDLVRRLEDAGAAAIVMHSLFEEQIETEQEIAARAWEDPAESFAEALSYLPEQPAYVLGPDEYLEQLARVRAAVAVPVIASLNGTRSGLWLEWARLLEEAGAAALELNIYRLATDLESSAAEIEAEAIQMVREVKGRTELPVAVKLSPYYTAFAGFARRLVDAGADGLVLFNRFYQPDVDPEELEVARTLRLSDSSELALRLRWLAILSGRIEASLAATGGVHDPLGVVKALLCGADAVQVVSALLRLGPQRLGELLAGLREWLEEHEYASLSELRGSLSLERCPDPAAYERANYIRLLQGFGIEA